MLPLLLPLLLVNTSPTADWSTVLSKRRTKSRIIIKGNRSRLHPQPFGKNSTSPSFQSAAKPMVIVGPPDSSMPIANSF